MTISGPDSVSSQIAKALGLPAKTRGFVLTCRVGHVPVVDVEYFPDVEPGRLPEIRREQWTLNPETRGDNGE